MFGFPPLVYQFRFYLKLNGMLKIAILSAKIAPGVVAGTTQPDYMPAQSSMATVRTSTEWYEAVGTVRPRTETRIEAQVAAQVRSVKVNPGDNVSRNQILISLAGRRGRPGSVYPC